MSVSNNHSPVLIEQSSPASFQYSSESSTIIPPSHLNLPNEIAPTEADTQSSRLAEPLVSTMDSPELIEPELPATSETVVSESDTIQNVTAEETVNEPAFNIPINEGQSSSYADAQQPSSTEPSTRQPTEQVPTAEQSNENETSSGTPPPVTSTEAPNEAESEEEKPAAEEEKPEDPEDSIPAWVKYTEDLSIPDEDEMKEIEGSEYDKLSALDISAMEEQFYTDIDDPEQRPVKKLRLSWVIKGVRGTRERPNYARVMNSPGAEVDGLFWSIKFYPRGDNCSSLSAFVRCSREPPPVDEECPESEFSYYEGLPDANFSGDVEPKIKVSVAAKDRPKPETDNKQDEQQEQAERKSRTEVGESEEIPNETPTSSERPSEASATKVEVKKTPNWRVSAQLGMAIYNPIEPRTGHLQSDGHQFSRFCDDWGWVNFVGPWDEIHKRKRGQRQALLRNDTLAIDAYIRIYEDPTEALWWHESKDEAQWPSKELAGYFPMGTPGLYHSPAVAGITAWMLLAPFREVIQTADGSKWRNDSSFNPKPVLCHSQLILDQMRNLSSDCYVNVFKIVEEFQEVDEHWGDVKSFWEVFRRGLEMEFADEPNSLSKLTSIFDAEGSRWNIPLLPVPGLLDIQHGLAEHFTKAKITGSLPNFLPIILNRSEFDPKLREWKLYNNRVKMNDELDLSTWCTDSDTIFTLYGFVVHVGARNSGKFYSILRPGGVGTKWLAFEDGNGNKVFSYSKKRIQEYEGLEGEDLRKFPATSTRENAYMAIYIRKSCFKSYLPDTLEPYKVSRWLKPWAEASQEEDDENQIHKEAQAKSSVEVNSQDEEGIKVEIYLDECAENCENTLRLHDLRTAPIAKEMCRTVTVANDKTFKDLRVAVAKAFEITDHSKVQMWEIQYSGIGKCSKATLESISYRRKIIKEALPGQTFRVWLSIQQPLGEAVYYKHLLDRLLDLDLARKNPEEDIVMDNMDVERLAAMTDAVQRDSIPTVDTVTEGNEIATAASDEEQASVQAAVIADVQAATANQEILHDEVEIIITPASTEQNESSEGEDGEDGVLTPNSSIRSVSVAPEMNSTEPATEETAEFVVEILDDEIARPVVHGHLVDAAQHTDEALVDVVITHSSAHVPHGDAVALAQVLAEEIAIEPETRLEEAMDGENATQARRESDNRTPTPLHVPRCYGNIQIFDVDNQRFVAQRPFHPELEMEIGTAVRKQLGYDSERQFRIWRRQGVKGTESVNLDLTFVNAGLQDVFTLIVGDVLSDSKCEELKTAGKLWQPQQLIAYLGMLRRNHPFSALTSTKSVELADFGGDYYKGPLSKGRFHGSEGTLITSTGHTYTGPFVAGQKSGANGKMVYQNGDTYIGEWLDDERHGQGEYVEKRTGNRYVGGFENGKRWGQGTTYWQVADQQADMCQICYEEEIDALFYDCGHVCACVVCAKQCDTCPICRRTVRQVVKMYRA